MNLKGVNDIAQWLKRTAIEMHDEDGFGCASFFIDKYERTFSLSVGWMGGYDPSDIGTDLRSRKQPQYCLNAAIVKYNPYDCAELEYMEMPYDRKDGEVFNTMCTLASNSDWMGLARWFRKNYIEIQKRYGREEAA